MANKVLVVDDEKLIVKGILSVIGTINFHTVLFEAEADSLYDKLLIIHY